MAPTHVRLGGLQREPEFLIDTAAINAKYRGRRDDPRRWWTGTTHVDSDCKGEPLKKKLYDATNRFVQAMAKRGWDLEGKVYIKGPVAAHDINTNLILLGKGEYRIRAVFKMAATPKPDRIEIPAGLVKRDPDHKITLAEAIRAR